MTPRIAIVEDIPDLVEMGRQFHAMSPHKPVGDYDGEAVARTLAFLIDHPDGLLVRNDTGVLGGIVAPVFFCPSVALVEENFWWAQGGGQELRQFFEAQAKAMGAHHSLFSILENKRVCAMDRLMRREGYVPVERRYMKELN